MGENKNTREILDNIIINYKRSLEKNSTPIKNIYIDVTGIGKAICQAVIEELKNYPVEIVEVRPVRGSDEFAFI